VKLPTSGSPALNSPSLERYTPNVIGAAASGAWLTRYSMVTLFESTVAAESIWIAGSEAPAVLSAHLRSNPLADSSKNDRARRRAGRAAQLKKRASVAHKNKIDFMSSLAYDASVIAEMGSERTCGDVRSIVRRE
jgi:hypothetical protein